jgi:hypothetical protein
VSKRLRRARRGVREGAARPPLERCRGAEPPRGGSGALPRENFRDDILFSHRDDIFLGPHDI